VEDQLTTDELPPIPNPSVRPGARRAVEANAPTIEYAGFRYQLVMGLKGQAVMALPIPGQHKAAGKGKHCRAAVEKYNQERKNRELSDAA
jgi:hypothetical protein